MKTSGVKNNFCRQLIFPNSEFVFSHAMSREGEPSRRIMCADNSVQNVCANIKLSFKLSRTELKMHDEQRERLENRTSELPLWLQDLKI